MEQTLTQTSFLQKNDMQLQECVYETKSKKNRKIFKCDICEYKSGRYKLEEHKRTKHLGITYSCDECDFRARSKNNLSQHIKSKHEGIRYKCNHCPTNFVTRHYLQIHIQTIHEGT